MTATQRARPEWFDSFLADRGTQKRSAHTLAAYCRDFDAIAEIIVGNRSNGAAPVRHQPRRPADSVRAVRPSHAAASVRRCWSTWNTLCTDLYDDELIPANPMGSVGRPRSDETLSKALPPNVIDALLDTLDADQAMPRRRRDDWVERDRAMLLTALLAGLRLEELVGINFGDIRLVGDGAVVHVRGKGRKDRRVPIEAPLIRDLKVYLASRRTRFPSGRRGSSRRGLGSWPADAPLFVSAKDGARITRSTVQYRVLRLFRRAGVDSERQRGALVHGLRHTFATDLANAKVSVYELKALLGHTSIATSQRYVEGPGRKPEPPRPQPALRAAPRRLTSPVSGAPFHDRSSARLESAPLSGARSARRTRRGQHRCLRRGLPAIRRHGRQRRVPSGFHCLLVSHFPSHRRSVLARSTPIRRASSTSVTPSSAANRATWVANATASWRCRVAVSSRWPASSGLVSPTRYCTVAEGSRCRRPRRRPTPAAGGPTRRRSARPVRATRG